MPATWKDNKMVSRAFKEPETLHAVTLEVDYARLMERLARKAARNKSGRATLAWGLIKATARPI